MADNIPFVNSLIIGLEYVFQASSTVFIVIQTWQLSPILCGLYLSFAFSMMLGFFKLRRVDEDKLVARQFSLFNSFLYITILLSKFTYAQAQSASSVTATSFRPIFTVPAEADSGATLVPNIYDQQAVDAQTVCPGYTGSDVTRTDLGLTATLSLAGPACNVYGTDIETLSLTVEYQSADRLNVKIVPAYIGAENSSFYILPDDLVNEPAADADAVSASVSSDLGFLWDNDPTFSFSVYRVSTGDMLFTTYGSKLVFENQFYEFSSPLPEDYNLYGLGETIHGLRLGNNFTKVRASRSPEKSKLTSSRQYTRLTLGTLST